ncbi:MAG: sigma-54 interaction domain-containing protein [Anaerovoracaceae bacterium]
MINYETNCGKIRRILTILNCGFTKREIKDIFSISETEFEILIDRANSEGEMSCVNGQYFFSSANGRENIDQNIREEDFIKPIYGYFYFQECTMDSYKSFLKNVSYFLSKSKEEMIKFGLTIGEYAEKDKEINIAILIYRYTALIAEEVDIDQRKRNLVKSVLKLSKLEFMRGISPEDTLNLQREAVKLINQSNLTSEDALLLMYAGMGEHFAGSLEEGEALRAKGIKYMKQFDYDDHEAEAIPLIGWHYYLEGDFRKTVAYYESFILSIENREDEDIIIFAYPPIIFSYFFMGETHRALALAETIYKHAINEKDVTAANLLKAIIGRVYIYLEKYDTAKRILNEAYAEGAELKYGWGMYYTLMGMCFLEERNGNYERCRELIVASREVAISEHFAPIIASPFVLEALKKIKETNCKEIENFTYSLELQKYAISNNMHLKGIAYRHIAEDKMGGVNNLDDVLQDLKMSAHLLEISGNTSELYKTYENLVKINLKRGNDEDAEMYASHMLRLPGNTKNDLPLELKERISNKISDNLKIELETLWLELRDIISPERQQTRLLSSLCRTLVAESGTFAVVTNKGIELKLVQNIDKSRNNPNLQKIYAILEKVKEQKEPIIFDYKKNEKQNLGYSDIDNEIKEPLFYVAIPFINAKYGEKVEAILYLQSFFPGERIVPGDEKYIYEFAQKVSEPLLSVMAQANSSKIWIRSVDGPIDSTVEFKNGKYCKSQDDEIRFINEQIHKVANTNVPVLIIGETGVGKEVFAREVYENSEYKKNFVKVNCGAIPESLIESELFGYEKGSFTGATQRKKGYFELAEGGTIFLDEIGELSLLAQVKLLRVLQEKELMRVGGTEAVKTNFRLIAATNKDLREEVDKGNFRRDLYYRLNVVQLTIPPLRKRKADIPVLASFFIQKYCEEFGKPICNIEPASMIAMLEYSWPGNVREMENSLQNAVLFSENNVVKIDFDKQQQKAVYTAKDNKIFTETAHNDNIDDFDNMNILTLADMERQYIKRVISYCGGKISGKNGAAELLGLKRTTLISKMEKLGIHK